MRRLKVISVALRLNASPSNACQIGPLQSIQRLVQFVKPAVWGGPIEEVSNYPQIAAVVKDLDLL